MSNKPRLHKILAPLALGVVLIGVSAPAIAYPDNSSVYSNYHHQRFIEVTPFRSLNVTPRYYTPLPASNSYYDDYRDSDRIYPRQRRVYRRGIRKAVRRHREFQNYHPHSDNYIRIRIR